MAKEKKTLEGKSVEVKLEPVACEDENIEVIGETQRFSLAMYLDRAVDTKVFTQFIKKVETLIRTNEEYKAYLEFLKTEIGLNTCSVFHKVDSVAADVELHHYPFTLYSICVITANKMMTEGKKVSSFILTDEVLKLHFENKVGLVPLTKTLHELAHLQQLRILKKQIYGEYTIFAESVVDYLSDEEKAILKQLEEVKAHLPNHPFIQSITYNPVVPEEETNGVEEDTSDTSTGEEIP